jgi:hypothetical protein
MLVASLDWSLLGSSVILAAPGAVAAYFAGRNHRSLRTSSGRNIGELVEESHTLTAGKISEQLEQLNGGAHDDGTEH